MHDTSIALSSVLSKAGLETFVDSEGDLGFRQEVGFGRATPLVMVSHQDAGDVQFVKLRAFLVGGTRFDQGPLLGHLNSINTTIAFGAMSLTSAPGFPAVGYDHALLVEPHQLPLTALRWTCVEFASTASRYSESLATEIPGAMELGEAILEGGGFQRWP